MRVVVYRGLKEPPSSMKLNGQIYYYQWGTPHKANVEDYIARLKHKLFIKVFKWQKPGWANRLKGLRFRPDYYIYIRDKGHSLKRSGGK